MFSLWVCLYFVKDKSRKTQLPAPPAPGKGLAIPTVIFGSHIFKNASKSEKPFNLTKITHC